MPKEFIVFIDNRALSFVSQEKLNHQHMKWVETIQAFTFTLKHKKGVKNKVVDALSKRVLTVNQIKMESVGIDSLKSMYDANEDFGEIYKVCETFGERHHIEFSENMIQDGLLFKGVQLRIPKCSMRLNIIRENHYGEMVGHFGLDKTLNLVKRHYHWPKLQADVRNLWKHV